MISLYKYPDLVSGEEIRCGEVSEWFKELVLKTSDSLEPWVRIPPSPPKQMHWAEGAEETPQVLVQVNKGYGDVPKW